MVCPNCQRQIADGSNFCYNCGAKQLTASATQPAAAAPCIRKRLTRSSTDKKIAGVCGGLAEYFDLDATVIRIVWILAVLLAGTGVLVYLILWIALPPGPPAQVVHTSAPVTS